LGREPHAMQPVQSPERVARAVADVCERPRRIRFVPRSIVLGLGLHALVPRLSERLLLDALRRYHVSGEPKPETEGNLFEPPSEAARTHADKPPKVSTPRFAAWAAARFVRLGVESAFRRVRGWLGVQRR